MKTLLVADDEPNNLDLIRMLVVIALTAQAMAGDGATPRPTCH